MARTRFQAQKASSLDPLPYGWFLFFAVFEPVSTCAGAYFALFDTEQFYSELVPVDFKRKSSLAGLGAKIGVDVGGIDDEARMGTAQLGSCYLLLAMLSAFVIPTVRATLLTGPNRSAGTVLAAEKILRALFMALAIADWVHILTTIYFVPPATLHLPSLSDKLARMVTQPASWNGLLFGNIIITFSLFLARAAWLLGLGRNGAKAAATNGRKSQ